MKILFVQPPTSPNRFNLDGNFSLAEPLALETVAASVPGHERKILDMRLESDLEQELKDFRPDIVATTSYTPEVYRACKVLERAKNFGSDILTVVGGHHATIIPQDFKKEYIDVIVIGEGEITFAELVAVYENNGDIKVIPGLAFPENGDVVFTQPREMIRNLDETPLPARSLTGHCRDKYFRLFWRPTASLITSRGCAFRCNFCSVWKHEHGKFRVRTAERTIKEIIDIKEKYISISDDDFFQHPGRARQIYEILREQDIKKIYKIIARSDSIVRCQDIMQNWKEIGLATVTLGLESFRDEELAGLNKRNTVKNNNEAIAILHRNGMAVTGHFIINPNYLREDFEALSAYVKKMKIENPIFSVLTPLPGTDLYDEMSGQLLTHNLEMFDFVHAVIPTKLPREEFYKYYADLFWEAYSDIIKENKNSELGKTIRRICDSLVDAYGLL